MIGAIVPRPIALVTTVDPLGRVNAAPFSFFNCLSHDPPIVALGVENKPDMSFKDTAGNIRLTEVFTVNIVSHAMAEAMHVCAIGFPLGVDELAEAGLTAVAGTKIAAPRIAEAPAAFECRRHTTLEIGRSRQIILGEIVHAHFHADVVDAERLRVDPAKLDAVARLGGSTCSTIRDRFDMETPALADWLAGKGQ
jgi:flavin reductase (DIM6/NTAB) family NADH-FMN oxidoreductase RutF